MAKYGSSVRTVSGSRPAAAPPGRGTSTRTAPSPVVRSAPTGPVRPSTYGKRLSCIALSAKMYHESVSAKSCGAMAEGSAVGVEASRAPLAASHSWTVTEREEPTSGAAHDQPTTRPRFLSSRGWAVKATPRPRLASTSGPMPLATVRAPSGSRPSKVSRPTYSSVSGSMRQGSAASHSARSFPPQLCTFVFAGFLRTRSKAFSSSPSGPLAGCVPNVLRCSTVSAASSAAYSGVRTKRDAKRARPVAPSRLHLQSSPSPSSTCS
mmetsp:Transcript_2865/g.8930  ORF Transcript_2865/g.8930 Transcript_2865/m.8930 type:complete len:265 (+) Transcript_2865:366-1160(+)